MKEWFGSQSGQKDGNEPEFRWDEQNRVLKRVLEVATSNTTSEPSSDYEVAEQTKYGPVLRRVKNETLDRAVSPSKEIDVPNYSHVRADDRVWREPIVSQPDFRQRDTHAFEEDLEEEVFDNEEETVSDPSRRNFLRG